MQVATVTEFLKVIVATCKIRCYYRGLVGAQIFSFFYYSTLYFNKRCILKSWFGMLLNPRALYYKKKKEVFYMIFQ